MVWNVCHRFLGDRHAAEDAFQATFLLLAERSEVLRVRGTLGPWLHEVARRTACKARTAAARRQTRERRVAEATPVAIMDRESADDLGAILHAEIGRLSPDYRAVVVTCYLEGRTHDDAAAVLGWPVGTVRGRLARARARLQARLIRRGIAPAVALGTLEAAPATASVPPLMVMAVVRIVVGPLPAPASVAWLAAVRRSQTVARTAVIASFVASFGAGLVVLSHRQSEDPGANNPLKSAPRAAPAPAVQRRREEPGPRDRFGDLLPQAAVARLGSMRFRHGRSLSRIVYSPDGRLLASFGDGMIRIWETSSGRELHQIGGSDNFALLPDSAMMACTVLDTAGEPETRRLVLRDLTTGQEVRRSRPLPVPFLGSTVLNAGTNKEMHRPNLGDIAAPAYSPDGKFLAASLLGGNAPMPWVYLYDTATLDGAGRSISSRLKAAQVGSSSPSCPTARRWSRPACQSSTGTWRAGNN